MMGRTPALSPAIVTGVLSMGRFCPPCDKCAFPHRSRSVADTKVAQVIVPKADYGCVRAGGAEIIVTDEGEVGALRPNGFHPITDAGAVFHRQQDASPVAAYL
jgi:hypothetical protein